MHYSPNHDVCEEKLTGG